MTVSSSFVFNAPFRQDIKPQAKCEQRIETQEQKNGTRLTSFLSVIGFPEPRSTQNYSFVV